MIEGLKPYAEYNESGLPWLDAVPKHWDMAPNRALMRDQRQVVGSKAPDYTLLSLTLRGVIARDMVNPKGKFPAQFNTYKVVKPDDFVFCLFDIDETPRGVGLSPLKGMITGAYDVFSPTHRINPRFLYHYYLFVDEGKLMKPLYTGLRKTIQRGVFASLKAPLPPPDEQAAIVRFLDHANRKIDGFIRAKRKLIGLLNEQKQAIIQTAISKVSTPDCRTMPVRAVLRPIKRMGHPNKTLLSLFRDYGVIPKDSRENKNVDVRDLALCQLVNPGDVVMNKMKAWQGSIAVSGLEGIVSPDYMVLEFQIKPIVEDFFHYALRSPSMVANYRKQAYGVRPGQWRLMYPDFCRLRLPVPSIEEQQSIVDHIKSETAALTTAIARTEREIALMQEYRTRLTADLVTGKLDVREAAAKLPEPPAAPAAEEVLGDELLEEPDTEETE